MLGKVFRLFAYSTYFTVALIGFVYLSIPTDKVRKYVQVHASRQLKMKVKIDDLKLRGITGVTLAGIMVEIPIPPDAIPGEVEEEEPAPVPGKRPRARPPGAPGDKAPPKKAEEPEPEEAPAEAAPPALTNPPGLLMIDELKLDVNTLELLRKQPLAASINAAFTGGGSLEGASVVAADGGWDVDLGEMTGIDLGPMRVFKKLLGIDINTRLSGGLEMAYRAGGLPNSTAKLSLQLTDTVIPHLPLKIPPSPDPLGEAFDVRVGEITIEARLDKASKLPGGHARRSGKEPTVLLLEKLSARGEHIEIDLDPAQKHTLTMQGPKLAGALVNFKLVVHFTDAFFAWKGDGVRADGTIAKDESHAGMKPLLTNALRTAKVQSGRRVMYGFHCRGALATFKCRPTRPSRRVTAPRATPGTTTPDRDKPGDAAGADRPKRPSPGDSVRPTPSSRPSARSPASRRAAARARAGKTGRPGMVEKTRPSSARRPGMRDRGGEDDEEEDGDTEPPPMLGRPGGGGELTPTFNEPEDEEEEGEEDGEDEDEPDEQEDDEEGEEDDEEGEEDGGDEADEDDDFGEDDQIEEFE